MGKAVLDKPSSREAVRKFVLRCGHESWTQGKKEMSAWKCVGIDRRNYMRYKASHPEFAEQVERWKDDFHRLHVEQQPERLKDVWNEFDRRLKDGELSDKALLWYLDKTMDAHNAL